MRIMPTDNFEFVKRTCNILARQRYQTKVTRTTIGWCIFTNAPYLKAEQAGKISQEVFGLKQYKNEKYMNREGEYYYENYLNKKRS